MDFEKFGVERFTGSNYVTWSTKITFYLKLKGFYGALIDAPPPGNDADAVDAAPARDAARDDKALAAVVLSVDNKILPLIQTCTTAKEAWDKLANMYHTQNTASIVRFKHEMSTLAKGNTETITAFAGRAYALKDNLISAGATVDDMDISLAMLDKLPSAYEVTKKIIMSKKPFPTLEEVISELLTVEAQTPANTEKAYCATAPRPKFKPLNKTFNPRFNKPFNPRAHARRDAKDVCYYCKKPGHFIGECRERFAAEARKGAPGTERREVAWTATTLAPDYDNPDYACTWFIDSGAERHITNDAGDLINPKPCSTKVIVGTGEVVAAEFEGDTILHESNVISRRIVLRRVLYIPGFAAKLVSIKMAKLAGATFIMEGTKAPEVWHARFGHLGYANLERAAKHGMVTGMDLTTTDFKALPMCEPCVMGKTTRLPFGESSTVYNTPLALVSMDVCGPMIELSYGGAKYAATFIDHATGYSIVRTLKSKADVAPAVKEVLSYMEKQTDAHVKAVRTDNGSEYVNADLSGFFKDKGIAHQKTMPYTPEQNGTAERLNRTLLNKVLPMIYAAELPPAAWGEAIVTANYLRNLSPVSGKPKTPFEAFFGRKPDVSTLRVFGATAYAHVPKEKRTKLEPHAEKGIMVGYPAFGKGYRILMPDGNIKSSRNVVFDESKVLSKSFANYEPPTLIDPDITRYAAEKFPADDAFEDEPDSGAHDGAPPSGSPPGTPGGSPPASPGGSPPSSPGGSPPPAPSPAPESNDNTPAPTTGGTDATTGGTITRSGRVSRKPGEWWNAGAAAAHYAGQILPDPATRTEALGRLDASKWDDAMNEEIAAHVANNTWELDVPPAGIKIIPTKWVLTTKTDLAGIIERYKGRIVAKGFHQIEGIDYDEVFAPVGKYATLRTVFALAAAHDYEIIQIDIKNAFLQGNLEEEAPRAWHSRLHEELTKMGFAPSKADASLYVGTSGAYILIYVDDILIIARNRALAESVKAELFAAFKTRDLGEVSQYLGMHITRDRINKTIKITNEKMVTELVSKYGLADCAPRDIPVSLGTKLTKDNGDPLDTVAYPYTSLVGALLYLSITVRPDIAFAVSALTRFMSCPTTVHWGVAKGVLRYLAGTTDIGIIYGGIKGSLDLNGMCDSDYAADLDTRRSTTGYVFTLNGGAITWSSKKQQTVAASTTEAEYMAASAAVKEALWLRKLMSDLKVNIGAIDILSDNQGAIKLPRNPVSSQRSKHIDVAHHFARERVARGEVTFHYVPTADNIADALTKPLALSKFVACRTGMGMV
ncbi:Retrovirus-related Pol polyprotein from transposon TNT 1-94 [Scenedesmus sp. PABB004]|nr:Retrovirus-related Pol polyprotein from transposon TNT 1-94 [Scenedesmus sp. PABB004]